MTLTAVCLQASLATMEEVIQLSAAEVCTLNVVS
jgi:hypothetical protein